MAVGAFKRRAPFSGGHDQLALGCTISGGQVAHASRRPLAPTPQVIDRPRSFGTRVLRYA